MTTKLKSLELQGYKTFASRSLFEFPGQITAIVGPNGSGKSNIADAVRWVLGEQSYSLLRGRKTEDMIFAGSEMRPRAGMASASIVFNNEDSWLPIDYSEVLLARKAYRDGKNEYYLNGQHIRLKETSELLSQSGLAERTYTIIGQGLVDAALSLKPEERRKFFEEAAGIGLYRSRRDDSINRLGITRRNLERVQDILSELEPRLHSLERHAAKANEFDRVTADLEVLLRDWYGFHWQKLQTESVRAKEQNKEQLNKLSFAKERFQEIEEQSDHIRVVLQATREELNQLHRASAELHTERETTGRELAVITERQRTSELIQANANIDKSRFEEEGKSLAQREADALEELRTNEAELAAAEERLKAAESAMNERKAARSVLTQSLQNQRRQLLAEETSYVQVEAHLKESRSRLESLRESLSAMQSKNEPLEKSVDDRKTGLEIFEQDVDHLETDQARMAGQLEEINTQIAEIGARKESVITEWNDANAGRINLQVQLKVLQESEAIHSGMAEGSRAAMEFQFTDGSKPNMEKLSSYLRVPEEYEVAISAALGTAVDALKLSNRKEVENLLDFLASGEHGRANLLLPIPAKSMPEFKFAAIEGVIGSAADLIDNQAAPEWLRRLLRDIIVVQDKSVALEVVPDVAPGGKVVTLRGEVFTASGLIEAGKVGKSLSLTRPREIQQLLEKVEASENQCAELEAQALALDGALQQLKSESAELTAQWTSANQRWAEMNRELQRRRLEFESEKQQTDWLVQQIISADAIIERTLNEINADELTLSGIADKIKNLNAEVNKAQTEMDELPVHEMEAEVVHWKTQQTLLFRSVYDANRRVEETKQAIQNNTKQRQALDARIHNSKDAMATLESTEAELRIADQRVRVALKELAEQTAPLEAKLDQAERDFQASQAAYMQAQQNISQIERVNAQSYYEVERITEALDLLRSKIKEDFGIVELDYESGNTGIKPLPFEGLVKQFPKLTEIPEGLEEAILRKRGQLKRIGPINPEAQSEFASVKERHTFLTTQVSDLTDAIQNLEKIIAELDELMKREFRLTFDQVATEFSAMFTRLFGGGSAKLIMMDDANNNDGGIDIEARLPGRKEQGLSLLSGGERSLTAVALIFSLLKVSPTPFCVLDEVDAMLDEANVGRFCELLQELSQKTQFIIITHNRNTVQIADVIYGITMGRDSVSKVISLRLDEVSDEMVV